MYHKFCCCGLLALLIPALLSAEEYDQLPSRKDRKYYQLKDKVISVAEKQWTVPLDTTISMASAPTTIVISDRFKQDRSETTIFDSSGNVQVVTLTAPGEKQRKNQETNIRSFFYQKNRLAGVSDHTDGKQSDSVAFAYRKNGLMDHYSLYNEKNNLQYKVTYVYKSGRIFTVRKNNGENVPVSMTKYKYDDNRLVETQYFDAQFRLAEIRRYSQKQAADGLYNDSYAVSDGTGNITSGMTRVKDSQDRILEQSIINADREVTEYHSYQYDDQGFPATEKIFSSFVEQYITNRYAYDQQGNWTRKEIFINGILQSVILREIKYAG